MPLETFPLDVSEYLDDDEAVHDFLDAAFSTGDDGMVKHAIGLVAKARGMTEVAREAEVERADLYRALSGIDCTDLGAIIKVVQSLGLRLAVVPAQADAAPIAAE